MRVLSFDCANRSLAICYATITDDAMYARSLSAALETKDVKKCEELINSYTIVHILKIVDVTKTKTMPPFIKRTSLLKKALSVIDAEILKLDGDAGKGPDTVLIEYQMSLNDKSRCVSQQLAMHYIPVVGVTPAVYSVGPTLKNKVHFAADLDHGGFMEKYSTTYAANKNHARKNLEHWLKIHNHEHFLKNVPKKNWDDLADAFMQIFGWLYYG